MRARLPPAALGLGLLGLLPFIACALAALSLQDAAARDMLAALIAYGAVILSFLGGVHWGLVLAAPEPDPLATPESRRLVLAVLPPLIGWAALLAPLVMPIEAGIALLAIGFILALAGEERLRRRGSMPNRYLWLRWGATGVVVAILVTVITLRLLGARIIL